MICSVSKKEWHGQIYHTHPYSSNRIPIPNSPCPFHTSSLLHPPYIPSWSPPPCCHASPDFSDLHSTLEKQSLALKLQNVGEKTADLELHTILILKIKSTCSVHAKMKVQHHQAKSVQKWHFYYCGIILAAVIQVLHYYFNVFYCLCISTIWLSTSHGNLPQLPRSH